MKAGKCVALTAKAFETLCVLIRHRSRTVSKRDLMDEVWGETAVEENNLTQQISALRKALGERPDDHRFIVTVPGRGYSFVATVEQAVVQATSDIPWRRRFADAGARRGYGLAIAYILLVCSTFLLQGARQPARPESLAVLNFRSASISDEFIGTGISDTLRARLGSVEDLVVKPGSLGVEQDAVVVGRLLRVDAVVTGSVQRDHDRIRVAVQIVDISTERIIWGKTFDETESNVFGLQDSITGELARALNVNLARSYPGVEIQLVSS